MHRIILISIALMASTLCKSDPFGYDLIISFEVETENLRIIHYHNWSDSTRESRFKMISTDQNPFTPENNYAYVMAIDKKSNDTLFKSPSPALTHIEVSDDEQYIISITNIMLWNPFQLVAYNLKGDVVYKRHITSIEAKLDSADFKYFQNNYLKGFKHLQELDRIHLYKGYYYIDFLSANMPTKIEEVWNYLIKLKSNNHLSDDFSETTSNYIFWYQESDPKLEICSLPNKLDYISLLDPEGKRFYLMIK